MSILTGLVVVATVGVVVWSAAFGGQMPVPICNRSCQGRGWRRSFPEASKEEIRDFLSVFVTAFGFREEHRLKLSPHDEILRVYRLLYPREWMPDGLEVETLARNIQRKYRLELASVWSERLTLGDLFDHAQKSAPTATSPTRRCSGPLRGR